jgi:5'(3')-deoxyribonucleotidase
MNSFRKKNCISIDIDGVLNNYPDCWLLYINQCKKTNFKSKEDALTSLGRQVYDEIKHNYRTSGYKYSLNIDDNTRGLVNEIYKNYNVLIMTTRPFDDYPEMYNLTEKWLSSNSIKYDMLMSKSEKNIKKNQNIKFHIDDELEHCKIYLKLGIKCFLISKDKTKTKKGWSGQNIIYIHNLNQVLNYF